MTPSSFAGIPVTLDPWLTDATYRTERRTWRERLVSWPWRPWVVMKTIRIEVPSSRVLRVGNRLIMHPATWSRLKAHDELTRAISGTGRPFLSGWPS